MSPLKEPFKGNLAASQENPWGLGELDPSLLGGRVEEAVVLSGALLPNWGLVLFQGFPKNP